MLFFDGEKKIQLLKLNTVGIHDLTFKREVDKFSSCRIMVRIRYRYVLGASYSVVESWPSLESLGHTIFSLNKVQMKVMLKKINSVVKCSTIDKTNLSYL